MRRLEASTAFRRDAKLAGKHGKDLAKLKELLDLLLAAEPLPARYRDHPLSGNWAGYRDAHIQPDWLLLYRVENDTVFLARTGTHSDLFD